MPWTTGGRHGIVDDVATEDDVRRICLALPGVTERLSWGRPAWFARTLMARLWEDGVVTVKTEERDALAGSEPETFYWTPHHDRSPNLVLVRLDRVADDELHELLEESYRLASGR
ncbi:MmcQ/YjbR family DNA-binding protein [Nocardioides sp. WL0053]|uniref:MmcQ/YjbR family DNA-binding protein n=1 Tax=Nocardioides jiangsuensis TaxID=2866161 RepID=A0ABS7RE32_9ACTN|nr:MmcQ/YjbR family DNA-binding protein [Nocardioides jiangsuensis]MBY9073280.1 MmcQ/YjbR family DNA-binding protein [Nocardioides jiangsuensis]